MNRNPQALRGILLPPIDPAELSAEAALANLRWLAATSRPENAVWWHRRAERLVRSRLLRWSELQRRPGLSAG